MNRIHVADIIRAVRLLLEKGKPGELYMGSDNEPTTQKEFYTWVYERLAMTIPSESALPAEKIHGQSNKRCSNQKLRDLGWKLRYPNFREGYEPLISAMVRHA